jgi:hypothetical protein
VEKVRRAYVEATKASLMSRSFSATGNVRPAAASTIRFNAVHKTSHPPASGSRSHSNVFDGTMAAADAFLFTTALPMQKITPPKQLKDGERAFRLSLA